MPPPHAPSDWIRLNYLAQQIFALPPSRLPLELENAFTKYKLQYVEMMTQALDAHPYQQAVLLLTRANPTDAEQVRAVVEQSLRSLP